MKKYLLIIPIISFLISCNSENKSKEEASDNTNTDSVNVIIDNIDESVNESDTLFDKAKEDINALLNDI